MKTNNNIRAVFDHWNAHKVQGNAWRGCRLDSGGKVPFDVAKGIKQALSHYTAKETCQAIDNYALVLLKKEYKWTYAWRIGVFFTVKYEKRMDGDKKWWQFLPHNFDEESFLKDWARTRRKEVAAAEAERQSGRQRPRMTFYKPKSVPEPKRRGAAQTSELDKLEK